MKASNLSLKADVIRSVVANRENKTHVPPIVQNVSGILILVAILAATFYFGPTVSASRDSVTRNASEKRTDSPAVNKAMKPLSETLGPLAPSPTVRNFVPLLLAPDPPITVTIFASDCSTPKSLFNLQDADKVVCAQVSGGQPGWHIIWSNAKSVSVQDVPIGSGQNTFTLNANSSLGDWRVIAYEPFGGSVYAFTAFTVFDSGNPTADLAVSKDAFSTSVTNGGQVVFEIDVVNYGPSDAANVQVSDAIPADTTFVSFSQLSGPTFTCTNPQAGDSSGTSVCTVASLAKGEKASFQGTYQVSGGTDISNTATISSTAAGLVDPNPLNDQSATDLEVTGSPCVLSTPDNITVDADPGQAGAVVTYTPPTSTGDCGGTPEGQTSPISCNPDSGSFFPVGTSTVICAAQTGPAASFQVTVNNPGTLTISLNGSNTVTIECGDDFSDPGASSIDGSGQSVPVTVSYSGGFNASSPTVGTYTATYTATEGTNSVSATRTINVSDTEPPTITVNGANPYRIITGSCTPFVDPGASALDSCAGTEPVTSSISGPGGATSVNNTVPGTYTITYTATDGTHQGTATRTVLVGSFPEDESDQPAY